jgi:hypothetical protein
MESTINARRRALQGRLAASAWLRNDGVVIYSQEGTPPIKNEEFPLHLIRIQLQCSGFSFGGTEQFYNELLHKGVAEIREQSLWSLSIQRCD